MVNMNPSFLRIRGSIWASQIYPIAHRIEKGDWIVLPSKMSSTIHIGKVVGDYTFDGDASNPYFHYRSVDWFATDIPRNNFDQDILYSFGTFRKRQKSSAIIL